MVFIQVMSETVASALQFTNNERTKETRKFIRMIDTFFDCLNESFGGKTKEEAIPLSLHQPE